MKRSSELSNHLLPLGFHRLIHSPKSQMTVRTVIRRQSAGVERFMGSRRTATQSHPPLRASPEQNSNQMQACGIRWVSRWTCNYNCWDDWISYTLKRWDTPQYSSALESNNYWVCSFVDGLMLFFNPHKSGIKYDDYWSLLNSIFFQCIPHNI